MCTSRCVWMNPSSSMYVCMSLWTCAGGSFHTCDCHSRLPLPLPFSSVSWWPFCKACREFVSAWTTSWSQVHQTKSTHVTSVASCNSWIPQDRKLKKGKCGFLLPSDEHLGHGNSSKGLEPSSSKVAAIVNAPASRNLTAQVPACPGEVLQDLLTGCGYCPRFSPLPLAIGMFMEVGTWTGLQTFQVCILALQFLQSKGPWERTLEHCTYHHFAPTLSSMAVCLDVFTAASNEWQEHRQIWWAQWIVYAMVCWLSLLI